MFAGLLQEPDHGLISIVRMQQGGVAGGIEEDGCIVLGIIDAPDTVAEIFHGGIATEELGIAGRGEIFVGLITVQIPVLRSVVNGEAYLCVLQHGIVEKVLLHVIRFYGIALDGWARGSAGRSEKGDGQEAPGTDFHNANIANSA
jgi:hypothetical protein